MYCTKCGRESSGNFCAYCGAPLNAAGAQEANGAAARPYVLPVSPKSRLAALLLCFFFGYLGIHRFYVGKIGTGILWLLTLGFFGIAVLVDMIMIIWGSFTDKSGLFVTRWVD